MQIKQLPEYSGTPTDASVFPLDDNTHTYKLTFASLASSIITGVTATLNNTTQTVKAAIDAIGASLKTLTDRFSVSGTSVSLNGSLTSSGNIEVGSSTSTSNSIVNVITSQRSGRMIASSQYGNFGLYDIDKGGWLIRSDGNNNAHIPQPLTGLNYDTTERPFVQSSLGENGATKYIHTNSTSFTINGQWNTSSFSSVTISTGGSDERLKDNIEDATRSGLDAINGIRVRQFDWKRGGHWDFGIIAQEIMEKEPNAVIGDGGEGSYYSIETLYLVDMLIKAVQELSAEVEGLKNEG